MHMPVWWPALMEYANSNAEQKVIIYGLYGALMSVPLSVVGQLFKLIPKVVLPRQQIPVIMVGITTIACWLVSYHLPQIDRAMLITWTGIGAAGSGKAHDKLVRPLVDEHIPNALERSGIRRPPSDDS